MNIAIAGFGLEGKANYKYWNNSENTLTIVDEREALDDAPKGVPTILGEGAFSKLADFDMVIRTAGLAPHKITTNGKIWSSTNEFFAKCPAPIIGVTGTKGKGTTSSLIASILEAAGKKVHLLGNIGTPALEELPKIKADDIVVFELSSFQLWDIEKSPHIAVILMIEPDHLNVHFDFDEYVSAKANIRRFQAVNDTCIYHPTNPHSRQAAEATETGAARRYGIPDDGQVYVKENTFFVQDRPICGLDSLQLLGVHNQENACAAISAVLNFTDDYEAIERGLRDFKGLPHRLKFVRETDGVRYYDDSIATTPGSAIAAIQSFAEPKIIILGGSDKGSDYDAVISLCKQTATRVIAIGEEGEKILQLCQANGVSCQRFENGTMLDIVKLAKQTARSGDVVILSPAAASFDMFKNYKDRGEQFVAAVNSL